jgi:hypothetical protein
MKQIKLKEGQKVIAEDGNFYLIEKNDTLKSVSLNESIKDSMYDSLENLKDFLLDEIGYQNKLALLMETEAWIIDVGNFEQNKPSQGQILFPHLSGEQDIYLESKELKSFIDCVSHLEVYSETSRGVVSKRYITYAGSITIDDGVSQKLKKIKGIIEL